MLPAKHEFTTIVVGGGNAGYSAAIAAAERGSRNVLLIDKCPDSEIGGNTYYTAGAYRTTFNSLDDLLPLVSNVSEEQAKLIDMPPYTEEMFHNDLMRVTGGRSDKKMAEVLVRESHDAVKWLQSHGVKFGLAFHRQAYEVGGRQKFWGGLVVAAIDGGKGLVADEQRAAERLGITTWFNTAATSLITDTDGRVIGVHVLREGKPAEVYAPATILTAGGFEANPQMRAAHLGPGWDLAHVRGTRHNMGDGLLMAQRVNARFTGNWSGCHSTAWDSDSPTDAGDRELTNAFTKSGYPLGIMVNAAGNRFVDEGIDFRNYTYAKFGREILKQPDGIAFQIWDSKTTGWLRKEEYADDIAKGKVVANSLEELADKCIAKGLADKSQFLRTISDYNTAVRTHNSMTPNLKWDPAVKDGLGTAGLALAKSNWALAIDKSPFVAVKVTCGITFTFGGVAIDPKTSAVVSNATGRGIPGLYAAGEVVGGLFWGNYPGGSGLTAGTVFGRRAGFRAARDAARSDLSRL